MILSSCWTRLLTKRRTGPQPLSSPPTCPSSVRDWRRGKKHVLALACEGGAGAHTIEHCTPGDFCDETHYPVSLFDLVLDLYAIPLTHAGFVPVRQALHEQWEQTLAKPAQERKDMPPKIFISYSHRDEAFKDELVKMLTGLQRRRVIDAWQDRRIEPGEDWFKAIKQAINECDMAVLLDQRRFHCIALHQR